MASQEMVDRGVFHRSLHGGKWYLADVVTLKLVSLVTFFILARLLVPEDYGVITIVLLVTSLLGQLTNPSFGDALLQRKEKGSVEPYLDVTWTVEVLRSVALGVALYFFAPWIGRFFNVSVEAMPLLQWSGLFIVIPAFSNVRNIYLFKELDFRKVYFRDLVTQLAFSFTAIGTAILYKGTALPLFLGYLAQYCVGVVASYAFYPTRPAFNFQFRRLKDLFGFSKWIYGQDFLEVLLAQIDKLFIGRWLDPAQLGVYSKAKDLASTATNTLASLLTKVGLPAFVKIQDEMIKVRLGFLKSLDVILMISVPITLLLLLEGGAIIDLLLGQKWLVLVVPLKIFAFGNLFLAFLSMVSPVLTALGRPDINFKTNVLRTALSIPLMYVGLQYYGMTGLAWAVVGTWVLMLCYVVLSTRRVLQIPKQDFYPAFLSGGLASISVFGVDVFLRFIRPEGQFWLLIVLQIAFLAVLYYAILFLVGARRNSGPYATLRSVLAELSVWKK